MEENKEDAVKCIRIAELALGAGDQDKAIRFLQKAEKLYSTPKGKELLETIQNQKTKSDPEEAPKKRKTSVKREEMNNKHASETEAEYSKTQLEAVHRIKKCKNLYDILGIPKTAKNDEIKKAYKQLAFQLHPDKNKAPGADEAFKAIGNAHEILISPDKRKQYDHLGDERSFQRNSHHNYRDHDGRRHFTAQEMTAEEIFQMFFGAGFNQSGHMRQENWHRQQQQHSNHREPANGCSVILQMLPILLLILLSMMSSFFISDPLYSLHQSQKFPIQRVTYKLKVPYYVKENFHTEYQGSLKRLETSVEDEYITNLRHSCYREKNYRDSMIWRARNFGDQQMFHQAKNIRMPSCDALSELSP